MLVADDAFKQHTQVLGEGRRSATCGDGDGYRASFDLGGDIEVAEGRLVNHVHEQAAAPAFRGDSGIQNRIIRGHDHEEDAVEIGMGIVAHVQLEGSLTGQLLHHRGRIAGHHANHGSRPEQRLDLALGDAAPANDEAFVAVDTKTYGKATAHDSTSEAGWVPLPSGA